MNTKWGIYSAPNFQLKWEVGDRFVNVVTASQESIKPYHDDDTNEDPKSECQLKTIHKETSVWALSFERQQDQMQQPIWTVLDMDTITMLCYVNVLTQAHSVLCRFASMTEQNSCGYK